jgi:hypothetical protein
VSLWPVGHTRWRILFAAIVLAGLAAATFWSRTFLDFTGVRLKVVQEARAGAQSEVRVTLPDSPRFARMAPPIVLIARLRTLRPQATTIDIFLNDTPVDRVTLDSGQDRRIDLVVPGRRAIKAGDILSFKSTPASNAPTPTWSLEYLEVANHHGSSRALLTFFIVPRDTDTYDAPGVIATTMVALAMLFLLLRSWPLALALRPALPLTPPPLTLGRLAPAAQGIATTLVAMIFIVTLASAVVTPYKLLLTPKAFLLCAFVLTWPGVRRTYADLREWLGGRVSRGRTMLDGTMAAAIVTLFYVSLMQGPLAEYGGNYSGFLHIDQLFAEHVPFLANRPDLTSQLVLATGGGYDGQFVYTMAFDPFLLAFKHEPVRYRAVVDAPPYRYGRIGFSLLTKLLSADQPTRYPITMVWTIVASSALGALLLAAIARDHGYSASWGALYVLVPAFVQSLQVALPEPLAAAGLLAGYWLTTRRRSGLAAICFAASLLVRETGIVVVIALVLWQALRLRDRRTAAVLACSLLPWIAWRAYVGWRLFPDFGWEAVFFNPRNTGLPFSGLIALWIEVISGRYHHGAPGMAAAGLFFPLLLIAALAIGVYLLWTRRDGLALAIVAYGLLAVSLNYEAIWTHVGNGERGTYELFLLMMVAFISTPADVKRDRRILGLFLIGTLLYLSLASVDSGLVRYTLIG